MGMVRKPKDTLDRDTVKDMIYGALRELSNNKKFYYGGISDDFSQLTQQGGEELIMIFNKFLPLLRRAEEADLRERAKRLVYNELGDNKDHDGSMEDYL